MDNVVNNVEMYESSSYGESEESDEELYSSNIGVQYTPIFNEGDKLLDDTKLTEYESIRNKYFTPELTKVRFTYSKTTASNVTIYLDKNFSLETKNIIGFKLVKSGIINNNITDSHADLIITEIPGKACMKNENNVSIIDRIPLYQNVDTYYHYDDYKNDIYFNPISLDALTLDFNKKGYLTFEVTYLNI